MSAFLAIDPRHPTPIYVQLDHGIRAAVSNGRLPPGTQLPTVRQLAVDVSVNANTVARVYRDLERAGILETRRGIGTFVSAHPPIATPKRHTRDAELRALARRCLNEAVAGGFDVHDLVRQLEELADIHGG